MMDKLKVPPQIMAGPPIIMAGKSKKLKSQYFKFLPVVLIFMFCVSNFMGCAEFQHKDVSLNGPPPLEPQTILKFSDVPVPVGFKLLPRDSYSFEGAGVRVGILKYQGKANSEQVVNFYKEQMQIYNWNLLNVIEYGNSILNFDRNTESCIINLLPKGNTVIVTVSLGPKSQILAKKSDKPLK